MSDIAYGVPQGSVLGPLLFLIYVNDLYRAVSNCEVRLFADDTSVFMHNKNFQSLIDSAEMQLKNLYQWCKHNKLTINNSKTCFMIFHTKNKNAYETLQHLDIYGAQINRVKHAKYLGLIFDDMLSWNDHIYYVCQSLMKYFGIFNHIKSFISKMLVRQLYFAFIYSRLSYGIECFGNSSQSKLNDSKLFKTNCSN